MAGRLTAGWTGRGDGEGEQLHLPQASRQTDGRCGWHARVWVFQRVVMGGREAVLAESPRSCSVPPWPGRYDCRRWAYSATPHLCGPWRSAARLRVASLPAPRQNRVLASWPRCGPVAVSSCPSIVWCRWCWAWTRCCRAGRRRECQTGCGGWLYGGWRCQRPCPYHLLHLLPATHSRRYDHH